MKKILSFLIVSLVLSSCTSPDTEDVYKNGRCMSIVDAFSIPPRKCISKSFALQNGDPTVNLGSGGVSTCTKICYEGPPKISNDCGGGSVNPTNPADDCCRSSTGILTCRPAGIWNPLIPTAGFGAVTKICRNEIFEIRSNPLVPGDGIIEYIVNEIGDTMIDKTELIFESMVGEPADATMFPIERVLYTLMTLLIAVYASTIILGITKVNGYTFLLFILKITLVFLFVTDFELFNFYVIGMIEEGFIAPMSAAMMEAFSNSQTTTTVFEQIDGTISMFLSENFWKVLLALLFSSLSGAAYTALFVILMISYMTAVIKGIWVYLIALIARFLLFSLAPIFLLFALFTQTKGLFDGWVQQILSFSLQPIFLFAYLGMMHLIIRGMLDTTGLQSGGINQDQYGGIITEASRYNQVCWDVAIKTSSFIGDIYWWRLADVTGAPLEGKNADVPFNFWVVLSVILITWLMKDMARWSVEMAASISGGFLSASNIPAYGAKSLGAIGGMATAGLLGGASGLVMGSRTGPGLLGTVRRQGGMAGRLLQGRGTILGGAKKKAGTAHNKQVDEAYKAMRKDLLK